jgi:formate dehydrogenase subunit gamma
MSIRIRGAKPSAITIRWIPKYSTMERVGHWLHTLSFLPLAITGFILYFPFLRPLAQGEAGVVLRLVHRITAVFFGALPFIYFAVERRRFLTSIRDFMPDKDDIGWVKGAPSYYLLGRHTAMPPQGRFNTGEKLNGVVMIITWVTLGVSGVVMWFGKGIVSSSLFQWMLVIHDVSMIVAVCMFGVHLYLAIGHPLMWAGLVSMRFGVTSADYAAEHHARWYYGPKRAQRLYEEAQKKATSETDH